MKQVRDLMSAPVTHVPHDMPLVKVVEMMEHRMITGAPVVNAQGELIGMLSRSDVAVHWARMQEDSEDDLAQHTAEDIMTPFIFQVPPDAPILEVLDVMLNGGIHRVVVTENGHPVGIVTSMDIVRDYRIMVKQIG